MANKYRVEFHGFAYVVADSAEEAEESFLKTEEYYSEYEIDGCEEFEHGVH